MRSKLIQLFRSDAFDSMKVGFKYLLGVVVILLTFILIHVYFPIVLNWIFVVAFGIFVISLLSYMIGDIVKTEKSMNNKKKKGL